MERGGGGGGVEGDGGALFGGRPRFVRNVLFGPDFNMGAVDLDSGEERDSEDEESSPEEQDPPPPSPSSELACSVAGKSHTEDPLSHYQSPSR
jgi:hypothetical protein